MYMYLYLYIPVPVQYPLHHPLQATQLDQEGRLSEAEQLYLLVNEPDLAISMYKRAKQVRLQYYHYMNW